MTDQIRKLLGRLMVVLVIWSVHSCHNKQKNEGTAEKEKVEHTLKSDRFSLIQYFESNKAQFDKALYALDDYSTDGGELAIYRSDENEYDVYDFWLYGESGKLNYTYWINNENKISLVKKIDFEYDKPYYEEAFQTDTIIRYMSFEKNIPLLFDKEENEITDSELVSYTKKELESFYNDLIKGIEIKKD